MAVRSSISKEIEELIETTKPSEFVHKAEEIYRINIEKYTRWMKRQKDARFVGIKKPIMTRTRIGEIADIADKYFHREDEENWQKIINLCKNAVLKDYPTGNHTGIVFSGYGKKEIFPTLVSFEIDGMIFGYLKYRLTNTIDIDRDGEQAKVIPFAQKEMVERFLYGLDNGIERNILSFCRNTVPDDLPLSFSSI